MQSLMEIFSPVGSPSSARLSWLGLKNAGSLDLSESRMTPLLVAISVPDRAKSAYLREVKRTPVV